ncbi:MAG TPA: uroporphyrinogen-III C-methyltransferase [Chlorobaculum sp.]|uniref:uroporphyrinogen-III C-methyltransferase n=1 Tax=Chlorobaculum tepidum (strain ATCC 49652 / DSM 12025 / NBRC 103806 / TLS) TaxID=194439 RepID=Q8KAC5_CHLTE|nr:uroporphyrinogen-III C-methyltransferase [Chlorobaculum tepidum]AAM73454.1 siroheme synthetase, putative [Chlorobaculum tepidum TLS]HBU23167.1 uroporphyrinogen-III C-methyltransferase [Chlorobaculum sp.]
MTGSIHTEPQAAAKRGYVYIAGAGPGDPELLTLKADRVLRGADVILFDDLVLPQMLEPYKAEKIYTGKRKDAHHFAQDEINQEIVRHALMGKTVVRLKGGDPFIFGRGGEEIETLRQHGIGYEIIPGITAAHGASAYSEIPLTMRKVSSSVAFCTGHPVNSIQVPDTDTIVYYMVASNVHDVLDKVAASGRSGETMVAVVQNATRYNQRVITSTLDEFRKREKAVYSPALLIIGQNISQYIEENWFSRKKKVLMTGEAPKKYPPADYITVPFPCQQVAGADLGAVKACIEGIDRFSMLFFQNRFAVRYFFKYLFEHGRDVRHLAHLVICTANRSVASALQEYGIIPDCCLDREGVDAIAAMLRKEELTGQRILLSGAEHVDELVAGQLREGGNEVTPLVVYVHGAQDQVEKIDLDFIDEIYFASADCVKKFRGMYDAIPARIAVTPADERTAEEMRRQFGG